MLEFLQKYNQPVRTNYKFLCFKALWRSDVPAKVIDVISVFAAFVQYNVRHLFHDTSSTIYFCVHPSFSYWKA